MCFAEVNVWSDKDIASLGFSIVERQFFFELLFSIILEKILQYLLFLKVCGL